MRVAEALVSDLATINWDALARTWSGGPGDWMHLRRAVSACLTMTFGGKRKGQLHPFRVEVMDLFPTKKGVQRVPDLTPELFWQIVEAAPEHVRAPFVTIVITGTRKSEYLRLLPEDLLHATHQVRIWDGKTEESKAVVPVDASMWEWVVAGVPSPVGALWRLRYWHRACLKVGVAERRPHPRKPGQLRYVGPTLHDLRHCLGQWSVDAGGSLVAAQAMLRHASIAMTARYAKQKLRTENAGVMAGVMKRQKPA